MVEEIDRFQSPKQSELENEALNFVKANKSKYYDNLKKTGKLKEYCQHRATKAVSDAKSLISSGMSERKAWDVAINQEIMEKKTDSHR